MWFLYAMIGNAMFAITDVANSMNAKQRPMNPLQYSWYQSVIDMIFFAVYALCFDVSTSYLGWFIVAGITTYAAFLLFMYTISKVDVSVMNAAWMFMALGIVCIGVVFFDEFLTRVQILGAFIAVISTCVLSFYHKHISFGRTMILLLGSGLLYVPVYIIQKSALLHGESLHATFFYPWFFSKALAFAVPLCMPTQRHAIKKDTSNLSAMYYIVMIIAVITSQFGSLAMTYAYDAGFASLIAITENMQPFMIILTATFVGRIFPKYTPKELLTRQSLTVKIGCFVGTFIGMTLLAMG